MKVGDLLQPRKGASNQKPLLLVLEVKKHPSDSKMDRVSLQWVSRNGGESLNGEFSRLIVENRYKVV